MRLCYRQVIYTFIWEVSGKFGAHQVSQNTSCSRNVLNETLSLMATLRLNFI
jgi:hypothetical protein